MEYKCLNYKRHPAIDSLKNVTIAKNGPSQLFLKFLYSIQSISVVGGGGCNSQVNFGEWVIRAEWMM